MTDIINYIYDIGHIEHRVTRDFRHLNFKTQRLGQRNLEIRTKDRTIDRYYIHPLQKGLCLSVSHTGRMH